MRLTPSARWRGLRLPLAALSTAVLVAVLGTPAGATPDLATGATMPAAVPFADSAGPGLAVNGPLRITMITGDTVAYRRDSAGRVSTTVTPGSGRGAVAFRATRDTNGYYLVPGDAERYVLAGLVDRQLFNLEYLAANGYDDARSAQLPLIVQYPSVPAASRAALPALAERAAALPATTGQRSLPSINGVALRVGKKGATTFWNTARGAPLASRPAAGGPAGFGAGGGPATAALGAGLGRVWLDAKVKVADQASNAQIGASTAWAAGYDGTGIAVGIIDTGVDAGHPDLAGRITAAQNFVPAGAPGGGDPADVTDRFGHGTHVASTIAGTGAASDGRHKGVGPGAKLIVAKALDDDGAGSNSTVIEAMQWQAATEHARIVNMSLGGGPTDGTDPMSQAVNELSAQYGTLFVIAAGNDGPDRGTVAAPGAADAALTVGAVDRSDHMADFSARGPRLGDDIGLKPEIVAPGVGIIGARAAGTTLGEPLDERYSVASGTSMATPHVAGAAAILAQRFPDWGPDRLKAALVSTAKDIGETVYAQGAGRLDIGRAATQHVFANTAAVSTGFPFPHTGQVLSRQIAYTNTGAAPVTLALSVSLSRRGETPSGPGLGTVSPASLTIPAGGTATANLRIDPNAGANGLYSGRLLATAGPGGAQVSVPIGFYTQPQQHNLTVRIVGGYRQVVMLQSMVANRLNDTDPAFGGEPNAIWSGEFHETDVPNTLEVTLRLAHGGVYALDTQLLWENQSDGAKNFAMFTKPELTLDRDTTVTFDASRLVPIQVQTPRPSEQVGMNYLFSRTSAAGTEYSGGMIFSYPIVAPSRFWVLPTDPAPLRIGKFAFVFDQLNIEPQVTLALRGRERVELHPRYVTEGNDLLAKFHSDLRLDLADEAALRAGRSVRGKLVFLQSRTLEPFIEAIDLAITAGAAGVLTDTRLSWAMYDPAYQDQATIPLLWVDEAEGARVRAALNAGRPSADIGAQLVSPFEYKLTYTLRGHVPTNLTFAPRSSELHAIDTTYHAQYDGLAGRYGFGPNAAEASHTFVDGQRISIKAGHLFRMPAQRVEYFTVAGPDVLWSREYWFIPPDGSLARSASAYRVYDHGDGTSDASAREREAWNESILPTQSLAGANLAARYGATFPCDGCRQGDRLRVRSLSALMRGDYADAADASHSYRGEPGTEENRLFSGGKEVRPTYDEFGLPYYQVPAGSRTYRLSNTFRSAFTPKHPGTSVTTDWMFRTSRPATDTVGAPYECLDTLSVGDTKPCSWLPLIYPHYQFGLAPDDSVPVGRPHYFTITAQQASNPSVRLAGLRVWTSTDCGKQWTEAAVRLGTSNSYRVQAASPKQAGTIAVRIEAHDAAGNSVRQTILDAYVVR
ncbi:S8 family serine peptidase [Asanoa sp. NPDC049573]|uniref:S8 family peptidase n=1 Tax=Asanoa sp. NPDC049573 TaxID=3155396 RepID=UPI003421A5AB